MNELDSNWRITSRVAGTLYQLPYLREELVVLVEKKGEKRVSERSSLP
ncbi:MAG: hypothetical protein ACE5H4_15495 [Candidatus Thorarchaeota archaeon]